MKKRFLLVLAGVTIMLAMVVSCPGCSGISNSFTKVADAITKPTAREIYSREFKNNPAAFDSWQAAYNAALDDSLYINLPYGEKGVFVPHQNSVYTYILEMRDGEVLTAEVVSDSISQRIFMDVYYWDGSAWEKPDNNYVADTAVSLLIKTSGVYKIMIQPEILADSPFFIGISKNPQYRFPVAGKGNEAVMSFWGMDRDGGKRKHEGIDIFAKKGTPVVAATDGTIGFTGERGIGGRQVWLREGLFGSSLYYAHLDSIAVLQGDRVKAGDTLGFVGNTGNARFTPPHLHFGVYKNGAVDPLPFVYITEQITPAKFAQNLKSGVQKVKRTANLREGPATTFSTIGVLASGEDVLILGRNNDWMHVQTPSGKKAFLHRSLLK